jgi:hypothetical protein
METTTRPRTSRHPGRHRSERPADTTSESVADIAPEQAADIIGIRRADRKQPSGYQVAFRRLFSLGRELE